MTTRERRDRRAERLRGWAEKRVVGAEATLKANEPFTGDHAFNTQPGHIPLRARVIASEDRAFASLRKAESMESRADGIEAQLAGSIYSDDPDAVEQLEKRIATLCKQRDLVKAYNASCRKGTPDLSLLRPGGRNRGYVEGEIAKGTAPRELALPGYVLTNLSADIRRNQQRLVGLKRIGEHPHADLQR